VFNVGGQTVSYVPLSNAARILTSVYDVPVSCARVRAILSNSVPTGPYRGAGRPETIFCLERLLDRAARELGIDRVEIRRRNLIGRDRLPYRTAMGLNYDSGDFAANMEHALQKSDWATFEQRRQSAQKRGKLAGIGLANYVEAPVGAPHERVVIAVQPRGIVEVTVGTQSTGQGHATVYAQVVADQLSVEPAAIRLVSGDTHLVKGGGGTHSDRSMRIAGTLLVEAAADIRAQVASLAAELHRPLDVFEASDVAPLRAEASFTGRIPAHPTGAAVCEVEVDPETGALEVTRYTSVDDVGQPINPLIVHGQTHGGIAQGLGQALSERVVLSDNDGQVLSGSFADYAVPAASGLPNFAVTLVEDQTSGNPLRVKGGGESGITPALACVVNAAVDALSPLGVDDLEMPLSPARIRQAIERAQPPS
jgi:carbon-monoxide dehydrogenase large subunit